MARKGRNIYKRRDGRWEGRKLYPKEYERKGYISFYGHTYKEVKEKMDNYRFAPVGSDRQSEMTVREMIRIWFCDNQSKWKDSTKYRYQFLFVRYIQPEWGEMACKELQNKLFLEFANTHGDLSESYLKDIFGIIIRSCRYMNTMYGAHFPQLQVVRKNHQYAREAQKSDSPISRKSMQCLERYLLIHLEDDTCVGILIAMYTGLRIGELCALRWEDLDLEQGVLYVRTTLQRVGRLESGGQTEIQISTPKSFSSQRKIPLPDILVSCLQGRAHAGEEFVVKGRYKAYAEPRTLQYRFQAILKNCGLEPFHFHMLRHHFASTCLMQGFDFKSLSELLGHSNIQTTLNIYVHSDDARKKALMSRFSLAE